MKRQLRNAVVLLAGLLMISCGSKSEDKAPAPGPAPTSTQTVSQFKYYRGGWFGQAGVANWSHDYGINFTTSGFTLNALNPAEDCTFTPRAFTEAEAKGLFDLVAALNVMQKQAGGPQVADAGIEFFEITLNDGTKNKFYFSATSVEVPVGAFYAVNGTALSDYLKSLPTTLQETCTTILN